MWFLINSLALPIVYCVCAGVVVSGLMEPQNCSLSHRHIDMGGGGDELRLPRPLLEIPLIVFQADVDALSEVARVGNGPQQVGLDQGDVIQLGGAGCASLSATWIQENLRDTHAHEHGEMGGTRGRVLLEL